MGFESVGRTLPREFEHFDRLFRSAFLPHRDSLCIEEGFGGDRTSGCAFRKRTFCPLRWAGLRSGGIDLSGIVRYVDQDTQFFSGRKRENFAFASLKSGLSDELACNDPGLHFNAKGQCNDHTPD